MTLPLLPELDSVLADELRRGDDAALWRGAALRAAEEIAGLDLRLEAPPRHVHLALAKPRRRTDGGHEDDSPVFAAWWERERGGAFAPVRGTPRLRRRRGHFVATLLLPGGTEGLAWIDALMLWRPHLPWAPPDAAGSHEIGRSRQRWRRDADARWVFAGMDDGA